MKKQNDFIASFEVGRRLKEYAHKRTGPGRYIGERNGQLSESVLRLHNASYTMHNFFFKDLEAKRQFLIDPGTKQFNLVLETYNRIKPYRYGTI